MVNGIPDGVENIVEEKSGPQSFQKHFFLTLVNPFPNKFWFYMSAVLVF